MFTVVEKPALKPVNCDSFPTFPQATHPRLFRSCVGKVAYCQVSNEKTLLVSGIGDFTT